jgi:hypothetical protein
MVAGGVRFSPRMWRCMSGSIDQFMKPVGETVKTVTFLPSALMSLVLLTGCADKTEQQLSQIQKDLEQVLGTALLNGDIRMQRTSDHLTVVMTE